MLYYCSHSKNICELIINFTIWCFTIPSNTRQCSRTGILCYGACYSRNNLLITLILNCVSEANIIGVISLPKPPFSTCSLNFLTLRISLVGSAVVWLRFYLIPGITLEFIPYPCCFFFLSGSPSYNTVIFTFSRITIVSIKVNSPSFISCITIIKRRDCF